MNWTAANQRAVFSKKKRGSDLHSLNLAETVGFDRLPLEQPSKNMMPGSHNCGRLPPAAPRSVAAGP